MRRLEARWDRRQGRPGRVEVSGSAYLPYPGHELWRFVTNPYSLMIGGQEVSAVLPLPGAPVYPATGSRICFIQPLDDLVVAQVMEVVSMTPGRHITVEWRSSRGKPQTWYDFTEQTAGVRWTIGYRLPCVAGREREVEAELRTRIRDEHDRTLRFMSTGARLADWPPVLPYDPSIPGV